MCAKMIVQIAIVDSHTGRELWKKTFGAQGKNASSSILANDNVASTFKATLENLISQLLADPNFKQMVS